jgi:hypothetical protein
VDVTVWKAVDAERCTYRLGRGRWKRAGVRYHLACQTGQHITQYLASYLLYFTDSLFDKDSYAFKRRFCQRIADVASTVEPYEILSRLNRQPKTLIALDNNCVLQRNQRDCIYSAEHE